MKHTEYTARRNGMLRAVSEPRMEVYGDQLYITYKDAVTALSKQISQYLIEEEGMDASGAAIEYEKMSQIELLEHRELLMEIIGDGLPFLVTRYMTDRGIQLNLLGLMPSKTWGYSGLREFVFKGVRYHSVYYGSKVKSAGWQYEDTSDYYHSIGGILSWEDMGSHIRIYMKHGDNVACFKSEYHKHPRAKLSRSVVVSRPHIRGVMAYAGTSTVSHGLHRAQPLRFADAVKRTFTQVGNEAITWKRNDFLVEGIDFKVEGVALNVLASLTGGLEIRYYKATSLKTTDVCYFLHNSNHKGITMLTPKQPVHAALVKSTTVPLWYDAIYQHMMLINDYVKTNNKPHGICHA